MVFVSFVQSCKQAQQASPAQAQFKLFMVTFEKSKTPAENKETRTRNLLQCLILTPGDVNFVLQMGQKHTLGLRSPN